MNTDEKVEYAIDLMYNTLYKPNGLTSPRVVIGYFPKTEEGNNQKELFKVLKKEHGFKRTILQMVYAGKGFEFNQTAGIVKKIEDMEPYEEAHVRFYDNGYIDCELEIGRLSSEHWVGERASGKEYLENIVNASNQLNAQTKENLKSQIKDLNHSNLYKKSWNNPAYRNFILGNCVGLYLFALGIKITIDELFWAPIFKEVIKNITENKIH